jgi:hypothetical protein
LSRNQLPEEKARDKECAAADAAGAAGCDDERAHETAGW